MTNQTISKEEARECVRKLLLYLGEDPERDGLRDTPDRVVKSYEQLFAGYGQEAADVLKTFFETRSDEMVVLTDIELYSTCEHHMLPFYGKCHVGYMPKDRVIGISKLARLMEVYSRRLQIQEQLTFQIAQSLLDETEAYGAAVVIEAKHMCMTCRGVNKQNSIMRTSAMLGRFREDSSLKKEFMDLINIGRS